MSPTRREHGPWLDVHAHPGRCFLAGMAGDELLVQLLGGATCDDSVAEMEQAGMAAVSFATVSDLRVLGVTPEGGLTAARPFEPGEAYADHLRQLTALVDLAERLGLPVVRTASDIDAAHAAGRPAVLLTCEGADFVEGDLGRLAEAHEAGFRSVTLVHYRDNGLGDLQTEPPAHGGLTPAGAEVIAEMNRLGMIVDLAHATHETTVAALKVSSAPVMISHTHLNRDPGHARLVSTGHARAVAEAGGVIGAWPAGVVCRTLDDFAVEIARLVDAVGVDHVAIGTDMDANYQPVVTAYSQFEAIDAALASRGFTPAERDRVLGANVADLIRAVCG